MNDRSERPAARRWLLLARTLLLLFSGLWLLFMILSRWGEGFSAAGLPTLFTRGGGVMVLVVITWRWPLLGGSLLVLVGLLLFGGAFSFAENPPLWLGLALAAPPVLTGALNVAAALLRARGEAPRGAGDGSDR